MPPDADRVPLPTRLPPFTEKDGARMLHVVVETARGARNKLSFDEELGVFRLKKVLPEGMSFPYDFGFVPSTKGGDGDPLDALVLMSEAVLPLTIVRARVIGGLAMRDDKGEDDKIIAVCVDDPAFKDYRSIAELPPHVMIELDRFFRDYKVLEGKHTEVDKPYARDRALAVVRDAIAGYTRGALS